MDAVIYCRISRDREGTEVGVDRQLEDCRALAEREGLRVVREYVENDVSASTRSRKRRPLYEEMIRQARAGEFQVILGYSNSRITRRPLENEALISLFEARGVRSMTVVSGQYDLATADGRAVARTLAAWDAAEAERTAERVTRAKKQTAEKGGYRGGRRPFGYEVDGMTPRPDEASALAQGAKDLLAGISLNEVVRRMTALGLATTSGKPLDGTSLRRILLRPRNAGLIEVGGQVTGRAAWPAIVPEDQWRGVRAVLTDPHRRTSPGSKRRWLGSGLYACSVCGSGLRSHSSPGRRPSYVCPEGRHVARDAQTLDAFVQRVVAERLAAPDLADLLAPPPADMRADQTLAASLRVQMDEVAEQCGRGAITPAQMAIASRGLSARLEAVEARLARHYRTGPLRVLAAAPAADVAFLDAPLEVRRQVIVALADIVVTPGRRGRPQGWRPGQPYTDLKSVQVRWRIAPEGAREGLAAAG